MNAAEHVVESYFRLCRGCFTLPDHKVADGNNRQFDLLAFNPKTKEQFHIEVSVTHQLNWCETSQQLRYWFEKKFFGVPPKRESANSDFNRGKNFLDQINKAYEKVGFLRAEIQRVWVCWMVKGENNSQPIHMPHNSEGMDTIFEIEILSLRDYILPALIERISKANYDDAMLRLLGFMKEREIQLKSATS